MAYTRKKHTEPPVDARMCEHEGCEGSGEYRAPKSREQLDNYYWFCLEHVREYNKKWDYFHDMDEGEIEDFIREAVTGHRPTWDRAGFTGKKAAHYAERLEESLRQFFEDMGSSYSGPPTLGDAERKALAALDIKAPTDLKAIKTRYRKLAKECHPDLHKNDKKLEERFKTITAAYAVLEELYAIK